MLAVPIEEKTSRACSECGCPTDGPVLHLAEGKWVCCACFDLYEAVCSNPWFLKAQSDWETLERQRQKRHNQLKPGGNYFPDEV